MSNVVITGIGLVTPLGIGREKTWNALLKSESAVSRDKELPDLLSARIEGLPVPEQVRLTAIGFLAANEALHDSGIKPAEMERFGCTVSVSKQNIFSGTKDKIVLNDGFYPSNVGWQIQRIFKLSGPVQNTVAACATGIASIVTAIRWLEAGLCDTVLCGAVESSLHPLYAAGFSQMGVLAKKKAAPFSLDREGFAMGEGAGVLVLEKKEKAVMRCARIYAEVLGWDLSMNTGGTVLFDTSGGSESKSIKRALSKAGLDDVSYINAHGTGTKLNDAMETSAINNAFGGRAAGISISSTKAATGHLLGAAGAVEAIFAALALRDNAMPPTLNLDNPDPDCGLNYTPHKRVEKELKTSMSLSFGFGGQIGTIIFGK